MQYLLGWVGVSMRYNIYCIPFFLEERADNVVPSDLTWAVLRFIHFVSVSDCRLAALQVFKVIRANISPTIRLNTHLLRYP